GNAPKGPSGLVITGEFSATVKSLTEALQKFGFAIMLPFDCHQFSHMPAPSPPELFHPMLFRMVGIPGPSQRIPAPDIEKARTFSSIIDWSLLSRPTAPPPKELSGPCPSLRTIVL